MRASRPTDLEQLARLFNAYRVFYEQASDLAAARSFVEERFERGDLELDQILCDPRGGAMHPYILECLRLRKLPLFHCSS